MSANSTQSSVRENELLDPNNVNSACSRCKKEQSEIKSRKEYFCSQCFIRFISGKQRKQMLDEKFRVNYKKTGVDTNVLLPILFNQNLVESLSLLDILLNLLLEQNLNHHGKQGFNLVVVILYYKSSQEDINDFNLFIDLVKKNYLPLNNLKFKLFDLNLFITSNPSILRSIDVDYNNFQSYSIPKLISGESNNNNSNEIINLDTILSQISDSSTKEDLLNIIITQSVKKISLLLNCGVILLSDSMSLLAIKILSLIVRGKSYLIYNMLTNDIRTLENLQIIYPLQEILNFEIYNYFNLKQLNSAEVLNNDQRKRIRNPSIDLSVKNYFRMIENNGYSTVVSTVVKTGFKLINPVMVNPRGIKHCKVCDSVLFDDPIRWLNKITVTDCVAPENEEELSNYQKYVSLLDAQTSAGSSNKGDLHQERTQMDLCYGCLVSVGGVSKEKFVWPIYEDDSTHDAQTDFKVDSEDLLTLQEYLI
ncbi:Ncs2p ASCRUDRAFT_62611 [Ascoidea rubescens DSM 1968]|uniref:Cytoplasmic tRNA 2-thiolation protein 2 n=1 Tax=Ascoidea rubescens DSM 1968 TaxID=1344418 RepID=A0A1D2V9W2_9ASCO|nr:hypothetical protein ASCRUDRAFT_62611 [Ascoidea rubescens DSM 1968]ODV58325.1 hypothetical protein ASCRUDRAFT_62611 [Ascoidea rubescens DSM 1968]